MNKVEQIRSEENDFYSDDALFNFNSWGADLSFRELIDRYENDELIKPELQRRYVWDKVEASRFIDSVLLGLPIPSIFLAKQSNETMLIIDGYQRIMTVFDYVRGIFSADNKVFKLSNTEKINKRWRGKAFSELDDTEQRRIRNTTIHAIIFVQTHPESNDTGMYQVFERINTSGKTLFPQEIRNCVYQGKLNDLLFNLNENKTWRKLFGSKEVDIRMRDMEFILRFFTLKYYNYDDNQKSAISLKKELNVFMGEKTNNTDTKILELRSLFENTIKTAETLFGLNAFHNISKADTTKLVNKFNPTIFDSIMIALSHNMPITMDRDWKKRRIKLLRDEKYQEAISIRTTNIDNIEMRIDLATSYLFGHE